MKYDLTDGLKAIRDALRRHTFDGDRFGVRKEPQPRSRAARQLANKDRRPRLRAGRVTRGKDGYTQNKRELLNRSVVPINDEVNNG